jgi:antitoxin component YwqK of YwqJK toxin-antitoxin module
MLKLMLKINKKRFFFIATLLLLLTTNKVFSQVLIDTLELKLGHQDRANTFTENVRVVSVKTQNPVLMKNGSYRIVNSKQKANLIVANKLMNGMVAVSVGEHTRIDYVITNSVVSALKTYDDDVLTAEVFKDKTQLYFKQYHANHRLKAEGSLSLDKLKHYGRGVTTYYDEQGVLRKIANNITATHTSFYSNGNKKAVSGPGVEESYNEKGQLLSKQYRKNNISYVEAYVDGKLHNRSYEDSDKSEVTAYYKNGVLQKKELLKTIKGEKRLLTYDPAGKLISNTIYAAPSQAGY